ncbi:exodeoxyribonuclease VII small subunit [Pseudorhodobacter ferrugineus]|uniref:exodeoxyribonuclease VII small subunit n=1 Tax=Pseudorhodobacter ferrugineus TaxID=77008 RepID=UPI0003B5374A|nr:exodeoxyribonuclease VII small subunit [Pseudorhodobacter ferrugineus]
MTDKTETPVSAMSFEEAMSALEQVVTSLERGEVPLEASIALYERGAALRAHCATKLRQAEDKVEMIRAKDGAAIGTTPAEGM